MKTDEWLSISEAAKEARVVRQAIFNAIKKGQIPAQKMLKTSKRMKKGTEFLVKDFVTCLKREDLNKYRENKHVCEKLKYQGEALFDIAEDKWSVLHASKWLGEEFGAFYPVNRLYYLIKTGHLPAKKHGKYWVLSKKDLLDLYSKDLQISAINGFEASN